MPLSVKIILVFLIVLNSCKYSSIAINDGYRTEGQLIFSIKTLNIALVDGPHEKTGHFFYLNNYSPNVLLESYSSRSNGRPYISYYQFYEGEIKERTFIDDDKTIEILNFIDSSDLDSLNFKREIFMAKINWEDKAKLTGEDVVSIGIMDGSELQVILNFGAVFFEFIEGNPFRYLDHYKPHNEKLQELDSLLTLFAHSYGKSKLLR